VALILNFKGDRGNGGGTCILLEAGVLEKGNQRTKEGKGEVQNHALLL